MGRYFQPIYNVEKHRITGLEALFGWLYLQGKTQRINELYAVCVEGHHGA